MGTIHPGVRRKSGSTGYNAQLLIKRSGAIVQSRVGANVWTARGRPPHGSKKRETELARPAPWNGKSPRSLP